MATITMGVVGNDVGVVSSLRSPMSSRRYTLYTFILNGLRTSPPAHLFNFHAAVGGIGDRITIFIMIRD